MKHPMYMSSTRNIFSDSFKDRTRSSLFVLPVHIYKIYGVNNWFYPVQDVYEIFIKSIITNILMTQSFQRYFLIVLWFTAKKMP